MGGTTCDGVRTWALARAWAAAASSQRVAGTVVIVSPPMVDISRNASIVVIELVVPLMPTSFTLNESCSRSVVGVRSSGDAEAACSASVVKPSVTKPSAASMSSAKP